MSRQYRKIHKWLGIILGIPLLMWIITGIITGVGMYVPYPSVVNKTKTIPANELKLLRLSPYDALKRLDHGLLGKGEVKSLTLRRIGNVDVYEFFLAGGKEYLINANSGLPFKITPEVAKNIARDSFGKDASVFSVELLEKHSYFYSYGRLPVYKVEFDDDSHTSIYISSVNGDVLRIHNRWSYIIEVNHDLHSFGFITKLIINNNKIRAFFTILVSLITVSVFVTGYYLAFRRRKNI